MFIGKNKIAASLACCMLPALCSCSGEHGIVPGPDIPDEITFNRTGGTLVIPVDAHGNWDISIEGGNGYKGPEWLDISETPGPDQSSVTLSADYFNPMQQIHERKAKIVLRNGNRTCEIPVRQHIGLTDSETGYNAISEPFADLWYGKGIGAGYDILKGRQSNNNVLNPRGLAYLAAGGNPEYSTLFRQTRNPDAKSNVIFTDTLENNYSGLRATCDLSVKYAIFKLNLNVQYSNKGQQIHNKKTYNASQSVVFMNSATDLGSIQTMLQEDPDFRQTDTRQIVSAGFRSVYRRVIKAYDSEDDEEFEEEVRNMLNDFGAAVVVGAELGGSLFVSMNCDSVQMEDKYSVGGNLTAGVLLGGISISADVGVTTSRFGKEIWKNSEHYVVASGGDIAASNALLTAISVAEPDETKLRTASTRWLDSIVSSDNDTDNTSAINITYTPIWNLFPYRVARAIKEYAIEYYRGKRVCIPALDTLGIHSNP